MRAPDACPGSTASSEGERADGYARRKPETTALYQIVDTHLEPFLRQRAARAGGGDLPKFVKTELRAFLDCGILARGFLRVRCSQCGKDAVVAFSCKGRGVCPSCGGRRMADTAAHLVDRVLPAAAPVRQWVLTLPFSMRFLAAFDRHLCRDIRAVYVRAVLGWLRRRARREGIADGRSGAVTVTQRFGSALNLNVHFHSLVLDGVFHRPKIASPPRFHRLETPTSADVGALVVTIGRRIHRLLERRGHGAAGASLDICPSSEEALLAQCYEESLFGRDTERVGRRPSPDREPYTVDGARCAAAGGFTLHADTDVLAGDVSGLERLCRYVLRPSIASGRLRMTAEGKVAYDLARPFRDGTRTIMFEPLAFLSKLAALVPPPRAHLVTYSGVLAPSAAMRKEIVPRSPVSAAKSTTRTRGQEKPSHQDEQNRPELDAAASAHRSLPQDEKEMTELDAAASACRSCSPSNAGMDTHADSDRDRASVWHPPEWGADRPRYYPWSELLRRVFAVDVLHCGACGGRRKVIAVIVHQPVVRAILDCLGLGERAPPPAPDHAVLDVSDLRDEWPPEQALDGPALDEYP